MDTHEGMMVAGEMMVAGAMMMCLGADTDIHICLDNDGFKNDRFNGTVILWNNCVLGMMV